jgi:ketosteroid isomerase-like protein
MMCRWARKTPVPLETGRTHAIRAHNLDGAAVAGEIGKDGGELEDGQVKRLEAWLNAYGAQDRETMMDSLAEDAVWHVGGTHRLSGDYRGRDAILGYFDSVRRETGDSMKLEPLEVLANERHGAAFLRVTADRQGRRLDTVVADAFRFGEDGRIVEFWAHSADQAAINEFWS